MDESKPDGTPRKLMDSSNFRSLSWDPISLYEGLKKQLEFTNKHINLIV